MNPAAIVRPAIEQKTHAALIERIRSIEDSIVRDEKLNLERAIEQGKLLNELADACAHGEWLPALQRAGISHQRASERRRMAKLPPAALSNCASVNDAKALISPEPEAPIQVPSRAPAGTPGATLFCRACRVGEPKKKCKDCDEIRGTGWTVCKLCGQRFASNGPHVCPTPREPGDDTDSEAAAAAKAKEEAKANGKPTFQWAAFEDLFGKIMRSIDEFGHAYECKQAEPLEASRQHMGSALESMKVAKKTFARKGK